MFVQQFFIKGIAHSSYLLGGTGACAIVDPRRDVDMYLDAAAALGMKITHILETHLHADFISGHVDLAERTGAKIYAPKAGQCAFDHVALVEGDVFDLEDIKISVLETPGHTPEHISYVVTDLARGPEPVSVFCGDTLFVGDVGRPDLFPGMAQELADKLYASLHEKLLKLPDYCDVYPAHGAGSLCGRAMGAKRTSTIGYERRFNSALQIRDRGEFIVSLTTDMPPAPDHFSRCSAINGRGPVPVRRLPVMKQMEPQDFRNALSRDDALVVDTRTYDSFGGQHVPGSYHLDLTGNFATFSGWVLPPDRDVYLVSADEAQAFKAGVWLRRVGVDAVKGYLAGGMFAWASAGFAADHVRQVSTPELRELSCRGADITLVDVRSPGEYGSYHIEGAINIPAPQLREKYTDLDTSVETVLICGGGQRSSLAASILKQHGFVKVVNAAGGMTGYAAAGFGPECPVCVAPHGPRFTVTKREMNR
jgi:hydroxyacylglutathione hydrolase